MLGTILQKQAELLGEKQFAFFETGECFSYRALHDAVRRVATVLKHLGVRTHDRVLLLLPNSPDHLVAWFAANYIGAVAVPVNPSHKGAMLEHIVRDCAPAAAFVHASLLVERGELLDLHTPTVVCGAHRESQDFSRRRLEDLLEDIHPQSPPAPVETNGWDTQLIIYTSGTTGPAKGAMCSYRQLSAFGEALDSLSGKDCFLANLPLYHIGGAMPFNLMLCQGGSVAVTNGFSVSRFWAFIAKSKPSFAVLLGSMAALLNASAPPNAATIMKCLDEVCVIPFGAEAIEFSERFDVPVMTAYSMTELSAPLVSTERPHAIGACGRMRDGYEARVVDLHDHEVLPGEVGELIVRTSEPWLLTKGYFNNPTATADAWRNGWFHTGDAFRRDANGNFFFVDRIKDIIRRRGENVSSFDLESAVLMHPAVVEAAAVSVPSPLGEDDILVAVVLAADAELSPSELVRHLETRVSRFMLPRYIRFVDELPKTPTLKIMKHALRAQGTAGGVDLEALSKRAQPLDSGDKDKQATS